MIIFQDIVATESIKIVMGLTVGAMLLHFRNFLAENLVSMIKFLGTLLIDAPKSIIKGAKLLGSDEFQTMPNRLTQMQTSLSVLDKQVAAIEHRLGPNGGKSLLDGVNQIKSMFSSLEFNVRALVFTTQQIIDASETLMFKLSSDGHFTWASTALQELVGFTFEDGFKNGQWENLYFQEDLSDVRRRWNDAIAISAQLDKLEEKLLYPEIILNLITKFRHNTTGEEIPVNLRLSKMPDGSISGIVNLLNKAQK